ncbi:unnamed protein product [Polarella glacialis]|uniref:Major facilitator superfamily (MFS) profile domain-containing protein n=1 Tax=Polarella glacialis TaxID=89957 RepID=A0A813ECK1_POLGL|nr:unnamed protein product [Polarella glacialis]CAE8670511.1 unnamed protein product [Polarella glacialis]
MGTLLERYSCVNMQTGLLLWGALFIGLAATITAPWSFILIRFLVGVVGATFVTNQVWCSLMFASNVVGTANACAAGWGNLGGGVTQIFMVLVLFQPFVAAGMEPDRAWRVAMVVPAILLFLCAITIKLLCWDTHSKTLRCGRPREDAEALNVGIRRGSEGSQSGFDGHAVLSMLRDRAGHEQCASNALQDLLPAAERRCSRPGQFFRPDEPLCQVSGRCAQRQALPEVRLPGPHLGTVLGLVFRGHFPLWLWLHGQLTALVRGADRPCLLLDVRAGG